MNGKGGERSNPRRPHGARRFPDPSLAGEDGLLCVGGDLEPETLLEAYSIGVFPWPQEGLPLLWFSPAERGILEFSRLHWPRRFLRELRKPGYEITFNRAFDEVIEACAKAKRKGEAGTWILPSMAKAYSRLHRLGYAHSAEAWRDGRLMGGAYGVLLEGVFSGESMFHRESDAGKRALRALTERLSEHGVEWMDIQMVTPALEAIGGRYVSRDEYARLLARSKRPGVAPFPPPKPIGSGSSWASGGKGETE